MKRVYILSFIGLSMYAISSSNLSKILMQPQKLFAYNLGIRILPAKQHDAPVMICAHGYGADNQIIDSVRYCSGNAMHLISFNFPDFNCVAKQYDPKKSSFGSIQELLPLLYVLKKCVIDGNLSSINLYGFSAGGSAVINTLAVLNHPYYDDMLANIGISATDKQKINQALSKGLIILDCPLKSIDEIMDLCGAPAEFKILAERYKSNNMRPIDALLQLSGLSFTILLYFENPDDILGNRDDALFIERLRKANKGVTHVTTGRDGGHNGCHTALWQAYKNL